LALLEEDIPGSLSGALQLVVSVFFVDALSFGCCVVVFGDVIWVFPDFGCVSDSKQHPIDEPSRQFLFSCSQTAWDIFSFLVRGGRFRGVRRSRGVQNIQGRVQIFRGRQKWLGRRNIPRDGNFSQDAGGFENSGGGGRDSGSGGIFWGGANKCSTSSDNSERGAQIPSTKVHLGSKMIRGVGIVLKQNAQKRLANPRIGASIRTLYIIVW